jgi:hypothetical protein
VKLSEAVMPAMPQKEQVYRVERGEVDKDFKETMLQPLIVRHKNSDPMLTYAEYVEQLAIGSGPKEISDQMNPVSIQ